MKIASHATKIEPSLIAPEPGNPSQLTNSQSKGGGFVSNPSELREDLRAYYLLEQFRSETTLHQHFKLCLHRILSSNSVMINLSLCVWKLSWQKKKKWFFDSNETTHS